MTANSYELRDRVAERYLDWKRIPTDANYEAMAEAFKDYRIARDEEIATTIATMCRDNEDDEISERRILEA